MNTRKKGAKDSRIKIDKTKKVTNKQAKKIISFAQNDRSK